MSDGSTQFRGVTFGGFHRQDVLNYLSKRENEAEEAKDALRKQMEELLHNEAQEQQSRAELESALQESQQQCSEVQAAMESLQTELAEQNEGLKQMQAEVLRLQEMMTEMEPKAVAYDLLKERTAVIELDAHERAQITLKRAQAESLTTKEDCREWVSEVQNTYETLRSEVNLSFRHSIDEMERVCQVFDRIVQELDSHSVRMDELAQKTEMYTEPEPEPQPLDGE